MYERCNPFEKCLFLFCCCCMMLYENCCESKPLKCLKSCFSCLKECLGFFFLMPCVLLYQKCSTVKTSCHLKCCDSGCSSCCCPSTPSEPSPFVYGSSPDQYRGSSVSALAHPSSADIVVLEMAALRKENEELRTKVEQSIVAVAPPTLFFSPSAYPVAPSAPSIQPPTYDESIAHSIEIIAPSSLAIAVQQKPA